MLPIGKDLRHFQRLQIAQREFVQLARAGELAATALPAARARLRKLGLADPQLDTLLQTGEPGLVTTLPAPITTSPVPPATSRWRKGFVFDGSTMETSTSFHGRCSPADMRSFIGS